MTRSESIVFSQWIYACDLQEDAHRQIIDSLKNGVNFIGEIGSKITRNSETPRGFYVGTYLVDTPDYFDFAGLFFSLLRH